MTDSSLAPAQVTRIPTVEELGFDPDALREKYRAERDKRLRADGNAQYQEVVGDFARYIDDPYAGPMQPRAPLTDEVDVLIVGGGFGGLICGARLRQAGIERIRIIEQAGDVGGTWYWNRYPGAACDTEAYIYLPLCEELGYVPTHKYAFASEILEHARRIARHFRLYDDICLRTQVKGVRWEPTSQHWRIRTDRGDDMRARFVIMSNGPLNRPKLPGIPGIRSYRGHTFHTSRWDYAYTGGGPDGGLDKLADKRVGIIGTGATAVQCVPHLGAGAKTLYVFQRTPSSVDVRDNRRTDPAWAASLHSGWQRERMENFNTLTSGGVVEKDLIQDGWTETIRNLISMAKFRGTGVDWNDVPKLMEIADFQKMNQIRARVDAIVKDKATAEALKPWYRQFCKRPCFHDDYLPTFNRDNVHLIDTNGHGVERITETGVVANGVEYEVDCIVFATGFEVGTEYTRRSGYDVVGREGLTLSAKWADGFRSLHGYMTHGFPNLFIVGNSQSAATTNFPHAMDESAQHFCYVIEKCMNEGIASVEPSKEAEDAWVEHIIGVSRFNEDFLASCTPGYYNNEGMPSRRSIQNGPYGKGPNPFFRITKSWREAGQMDGMVTVPADGGVQ
ncbi:MAG TPA: NAD(P)/FAD-dependent oxidoreductase [Candidatus Binatia bacterium]|nr:NAD(P)/FAD-dependent oxidoreductase [Candidatus Binatia bacterium]